jgi:hypothetical protein
MFAYFMPLASGARRTWSSRDDSFWCCVGSGMESHAKHGDSIYWEDGTRLYVNLFIPSTLDWRARRLKLALDTGFPLSDRVRLTVAAAPDEPLPIALRLPGWCDSPSLTLDGRPATFVRDKGYAVLTRRWRAGDRIELHLPMRLRVEPTPDDPRMVAFTHGPVVLAADLGPAERPFDQLPPALITDDAARAPAAVDPARHVFRVDSARPHPLELKPFFAAYDRRTAVYFPLFTPDRWAREEAGFVAAQQAKKVLEARTVDVIQLGEMQPERDHGFASNHSDLLSWGGRSGRQAWWGVGNWLEFSLAVRPGPMLLQALYWGEETDKNFRILVDGEPIATERRPGPPVKRFVQVDYPIPEALTRGKTKVKVRFETLGSDAPVYECRLLAADPGAAA